jgi:hypothetical protein
MKTIENSVSYCIEPDAHNMRVGIKNFEINELKPNFTQGKIGNRSKTELISDQELNKIIK